MRNESGHRYRVGDRVVYQRGRTSWNAIVLELRGRHSGEYVVFIEVPGNGDFYTWEIESEEKYLRPAGGAEAVVASA